MPTVVMGVWQIVRVLTTKTLKVNLQVFPFGADRKFADKPSAERELRFHVALSGDGDLPAFDLRGDYNGDRRRDLAFGDDGDQIGFYLGQDGARKWQRTRSSTPTSTPPRPSSPVDLDGKGKDDLLLHYPNTKGHRAEWSCSSIADRGDQRTACAALPPSLTTDSQECIYLRPAPSPSLSPEHETQNAAPGGSQERRFYVGGSGGATPEYPETRIKLKGFIRRYCKGTLSAPPNQDRCPKLKESSRECGVCLPVL